MFLQGGQGMSSTALKLLALILMLMDHIEEFIPGAPVWLSWIGRISAPLFIFCACIGFRYTHDRKKHLKDIYLMGVLMGAMDYVLNYMIPNPVKSGVSNNIFVTILVIGICCYIIEEFIKKEYKQAFKHLAIFVAVNVLCVWLINLGYDDMLPVVFTKSPSWFLFIGSLLPNVIFVEGGIQVVLFGILLYFSQNSKVKTALVFLLYSGFCFYSAASNGMDFNNLFIMNYEWMSIMALPFVLFYNNKKGHGYKHLFYAFYPAHIWLLFILSNVLFH
jgi:hypothetical protein